MFKRIKTERKRNAKILEQMQGIDAGKRKYEEVYNEVITGPVKHNTLMTPLSLKPR
jgi:hypothetical protein